MNKSIWEWLEIEPTGEISEIRAAYARQVKKYHPEDTPEEFEQLQKAYKSALRQARAAKRTETVPQSAQESQKSGSGFEKRDMPGFFENAGMTEDGQSMEAYLEEFRQKLREAGSEQLVKEVSKQYQAWKKEKEGQKAGK